MVVDDIDHSQQRGKEGSKVEENLLKNSTMLEMSFLSKKKDSSSIPSERLLESKKQAAKHDDTKKITMNDIQVLPFKVSFLKNKTL